MKTFIVFAAAVTVAFAAPSPGIDRKVYELRRSKKSNGVQSYVAQSYGAQSSGAPCGGGTPLAVYLAPQQAPQGPHYREDETEIEHEHSVSARSYYNGALAGLPAPAGLAAGLNLSPAQGPAGPAVGVFPGAKLGGCAVPLLLSCAPSVVSGHIAKSHGVASSGYGASAGSYGAAPAAASYGQAAAPAYREAKELTQEKAWSKARDSHMEMKEAGVQKGPLLIHAARESHQEAPQHQLHHETSHAHASVNKL